MSKSLEGVLRGILESACEEHKACLSDLTVLSAQVDPYRIDTAAGHRDAAEKKLADDSKLRRAGRQWRRERLEALLQGPYAEPAKALLNFCKTANSPTALLDFVKSGPWREADEDGRFEILALVDAVIIKRRERLGLEPFDDAPPGQPDSTFLILRAHLTPQFPSDDGATRGAARLQCDTTLEIKRATQ